MSSKGVDPAVVSSMTSGDVILMDRRCLSMKDPLSIGLCLGAKSVSPYDHVGMVVKASPDDVAQHGNIKRAVEKAGGLSPSGTYILEANVGGVTLRSMEARLSRTSSNAIAVRPLELPEDQRKSITSAMTKAVDEVIPYDYKSNLMDFVSMSLKPPDKVDRMTATAKRIVLEREIALMQAELARSSKANDADPGSSRLLQKLVRDYTEAVAWLEKTYFPLRRSTTMFVDGENNTGAVKGVFCSELIVHVWQRCGVVASFPPSTSFAPVDFDRWDDEFSFTDERIGMGPHHVIYPPQKCNVDTTQRTHVRDGLQQQQAVSTRSEFMRDRFTVLRNMNLEANVNIAAVDEMMPIITELSLVKETVVPVPWLVQSTSHYQLSREMPEKVMVVGTLFSLVGAVFAPWQLRSLEQQLGMSSLRGGLWSLSASLAARSLAATGIQAWLTYTLFRAYNKRQEDHRSALKVMRCSNGKPLMEFADDRHPFYTCAGALLVSGTIAGSLTHALESLAFLHHFGPDRPHSPSVRLLFRGVSLSSLCFTFSYGGAWLIWYECFGPLLFTTETSVFRKRHNQVHDERWTTQQRDAVVGAIAITCVVETILFPMQAAARRRYLRHMYYPDLPPARTPRYWSGYGRHMARSLSICVTTAAVVWNCLL
ncbi:transmembrane protein, putative [Bodo saltans]|uniref:Transmembrane protein, putative n=1 Tax=Bodo saltans TaxID=75058 RepID=A0A0S4JQH1_BODSA|nr:transmembrane protein, putative [Bodo saltans]|eukprot:CUG92437.1 transmembrane protein, putative [Bodo saltans]